MSNTYTHSSLRLSRKTVFSLVLFSCLIVSLAAVVQNNPQLLAPAKATEESATVKEPTLDELKKNRDDLLARKKEQEKLKSNIESELNKVNKNIEILDGQAKEADQKLQEAIK